MIAVCQICFFFLNFDSNRFHFEEKNESQIKQKQKEEEKYLNEHNVNVFLSFIHLFRVEVYTKSGPSGEWIVKFKGSPGNLFQFEKIILNAAKMTVGSSIISIVIKQNNEQKVCYQCIHFLLL